MRYPVIAAFFHVDLYRDANLKVYDDGSVTISEVSADQEHCNPANCSEKIFWKRKPVVGDKNYFTLESYNVSKAWTKKGHKIFDILA